MSTLKLTTEPSVSFSGVSKKNGKPFTIYTAQAEHPSLGTITTKWFSDFGFKQGQEVEVDSAERSEYKGQVEYMLEISKKHRRVGGGGGGGGGAAGFAAPAIPAKTLNDAVAIWETIHAAVSMDTAEAFVVAKTSDLFRGVIDGRITGVEQPAPGGFDAPTDDNIPF